MILYTVLRVEAESKLNICVADKEKLQQQLEDLQSARVIADDRLKSHKNNSMQQQISLEVSIPETKISFKLSKRFVLVL